MLDSLLNFSSNQAITATAVSQNVIDLGVARDLGNAGDDHPLKLLVTGNNAFASNTSAATLTVQIQGAPDNGSGAPGSYDVIAQTDALTITQLNSGFNSAAAGTPNAGTEFFPIDLPATPPGKSKPRFLRLNYVVGTENFTAGTIVLATLALQRQAESSYPSGFNAAN